jgi:hypothetical protein
VAISWSFDLLFAREIEQLVTVRDVERMETLSVMLRTMRKAQGSGARPRRDLDALPISAAAAPRE